MKHYSIDNDHELIRRVDSGETARALSIEYKMSYHGMRERINRARQRIAIYPLNLRAMNILAGIEQRHDEQRDGTYLPDPSAISMLTEVEFLRANGAGYSTLDLVNEWLSSRGYPQIGSKR